MDILDGRRAVPGDLVECIADDWTFIQGSSTVRKGMRFTVKEVYKAGHIFSTLTGYVMINDVHIRIDNAVNTICDAEKFRIIPQDTKSPAPAITFTTTKEGSKV